MRCEAISKNNNDYNLIKIYSKFLLSHFTQRLSFQMTLLNIMSRNLATNWVGWSPHAAYPIITCQIGTGLTWWHHQMETFSALLALCPVTGQFPSQRAVTRSLDVFFDLRLNKRLSKQSKGWWFGTPSPSHYGVIAMSIANTYIV